MIFLLSFLWFIRETKVILFWLYLWQLKEYHIGRFTDHFRTKKGKKLLINKIFAAKIFLLATYFFYPIILIWGLFFIYFAETLKFFKDFFGKSLKLPVLTKKTVCLIFVLLIFGIFYLYSIFNFEILRFSFYFLIFDILTPAIVSGIVLVFQPFTALIRYQIIKKAKKKRQEFKNLIVIGITGSYGKTSTKEFLATILSERYKVLKTKAHQNSEVGISQCILNDLKPEHEIFICEMGAYNKRGVKLLCDIAKPKIGILTGINEQHMAIFGSQDNIIKTKFELIESLPEDGLAIFNGNNVHCLQLYQITEKPKKICFNKFYTILDHVLLPDIWAEEVNTERNHISFKVFSKDGRQADFRLNLLGAQNIENILMAACVAKELGMNLDEISRACQKIRPEQGGMKLIKTKNGLNILDSTYSANPDGVLSHLEYLKVWGDQKVIVMPCLIELGSASKEVHKRIGQKIGEICDLAIITTKDKFKEIKEGSTSSLQRGAEILFLENPKQIVEKIKTFCRPEDVILLEGRIPKEVIELLIK